MKIRLLLLILFISLRILGQDVVYGFEYSFDIEISNAKIAEELKGNPDFEFSKSFKVFYTDKGVLRFIEKSNNYIQSSIFNNEKNELIMFDISGVLSKETGNYNKPLIKSVNKNNEGFITFTTTSGTYNYFYTSNKFKINSSNYDNLREHCFYEFILETGFIPDKITYELGPMKFVMEIIQPFELSTDEVELLNEIIESSKEDEIQRFIDFSNRK